MKKIIISLFCIMILSIFLIGCGKKKEPILKTKEDVYNYLNEIFPNQQFDVLEVEELEIGDDACEKKYMGNNWTVYSKEDDITFNVYDTYYFNSFTCKFSIGNDYDFKANSK